MMRPAAVAALVLLVGGCSSDSSAPEPPTRPGDTDERALTRAYVARYREEYKSEQECLDDERAEHHCRNAFPEDWLAAALDRPMTSIKTDLRRAARYPNAAECAKGGIHYEICGKAHAGTPEPGNLLNDHEQAAELYDDVGSCLQSGEVTLDACVMADALDD